MVDFGASKDETSKEGEEMEREKLELTARKMRDDAAEACRHWDFEEAYAFMWSQLRRTRPRPDRRLAVLAPREHRGARGATRRVALFEGARRAHDRVGPHRLSLERLDRDDQAVEVLFIRDRRVSVRHNRSQFHLALVYDNDPVRRIGGRGEQTCGLGCRWKALRGADSDRADA